MIWWICLAAVAVIAEAALCAAHIPVLRDLTDSAPLEPDPLPLLAADAQADYTATRAAGYCETDTEWAERTGNHPVPYVRPAVIELPLPAPRKEV